MNPACHIEVDSAQIRKQGQYACGDAFLSRRLAEEHRVLCVLADGLGSGIKANVLSTLTSTLALGCMAGDMPADRTAATLLDSLPVCSRRRIAYSTFSLLDINHQGQARLIESDNPPTLFLRGDAPIDPRRTLQTAIPSGARTREIWIAEPTLQEGDRLILFSDGVTQAGMGRAHSPLGWGFDGVTEDILRQLSRTPTLSARALARAVVDEALRRDGGVARDDMTCAVVYVRHPRELLVVTGPPYSRERDRLMAESFDRFAGRRVLCGGTTASLVARELGRAVEVDLSAIDPEIPPHSRMPGADLVTEGTLTLGAVARLLEEPATQDTARDNAALRLFNLMRDSDIIHFLVGTRINEAHQDPNVPVELDLRRTLVRRIRDRLERTYLKETRVRFL